MCVLYLAPNSTYVYKKYTLTSLATVFISIDFNFVPLLLSQLMISTFCFLRLYSLTSLYIKYDLYGSQSRAGFDVRLVPLTNSFTEECRNSISYLCIGMCVWVCMCVRACNFGAFMTCHRKRTKVLIVANVICGCACSLFSCYIFSHAFTLQSLDCTWSPVFRMSLAIKSKCHQTYTPWII